MKYIRKEYEVRACQWFPPEHPDHNKNETPVHRTTFTSSSSGLKISKPSSTCITYYNQDGQSIYYVGGFCLKSGDWIVSGLIHPNSVNVFGTEEFERLFEKIERVSFGDGKD